MPLINSSMIRLFFITFVTSFISVHASDVTQAPTNSSKVFASDTAITSFTTSMLSTIYTQINTESTDSLLFGLKSVQSSFQPEVFQEILAKQHNDELMKLAKQKSMVMTNQQFDTVITALAPTVNNQPQWQVKTRFNVYFIKDQIEIVQPMANTMTITIINDKMPQYRIMAFSSVQTSDPELINYQQLRQRNCPGVTDPVKAG